MVAEGADVVDVGGESTRPGAEPVDEAEELRRVLPVIAALAPSVRVSVDTTKAAVAEAACRRRGHAWSTTSRPRCGRWRRRPGQDGSPCTCRARRRTMQHDPHYDDVVADVRAFLVDRARQASDAGVSEVWIDPGIGFGKNRPAEPRPPGPPGRAWPTAGRPGLVGDGGHQPQELSGATGGGARRHPRPGGRPPPRIRGHRHLGHAGRGSMVRVHDVGSHRSGGHLGAGA